MPDPDEDVLDAVHGSEPLPAPSPDTAAAYLEELGRVHTRREKRVDRRALARMSLITAVVLSVYVAIACFAIGVGPTNSSFLVALPALDPALHRVSREPRRAGGADLTKQAGASGDRRIRRTAQLSRTLGAFTPSRAADPHDGSRRHSGARAADSAEHSPRRRRRSGSLLRRQRHGTRCGARRAGR